MSRQVRLNSGYLNNNDKDLVLSDVEWKEYADKFILNGDTDFVTLKNMHNSMWDLIN